MNRLKSAEHAFKRFWGLCTIGFLRRAQQDLSPSDGGRVGKILLLLPGRIGDLVCALPVADGLLKNLPKATISALVSPVSQSLVQDDPRFKKIFVYRKRLWLDIAEVRAIRKERFDCIIDLLWSDSLTGLYLCRMCAPGAKYIGVGKTRFAPYYHFAYPRAEGHMIDLLMTALDAFGINPQTANKLSPPYTGGEASRIADQFYRRIPAGEASDLRIGYNFSAGAPTRHWAAPKTVALFQQILTSYTNSRLILISMPSERPDAERLAATLGPRMHLVPEKLGIRDVSAIIAELDLLITPDTSLVHIARSFQVPVVGLYTRCQWNLDRWRPYGQKIGTVVSDHEDNIFDIQVDQVFDAVVEVLKVQQPVTR